MKLQGEDLKLYKEVLETIKSFSMVIQPKSFATEASKNRKRSDWYKSVKAQVIDEIFTLINLLKIN